VSRDAAAVVRKAMARRPEQRYADARALATELGALAGGRPTHARAEQGGALRSAWTSLSLYFSGVPYEYRSHRTFLGLPLVHVITGPRSPGSARRVARGWFASSPDVAVGGLALGARAYGLVACGGLAVGALFSWGGIALGLLSAFGGMSAALVAWGGTSVGYLAIGGCALGYGAIGGVALGRYAMGGRAWGEFVVTEDRQDLTKEQFFDALLGLPWFDGADGS
jgi:hypothetical protein